MKNLAQAILKVMEEVKGIDKSMTVGTGNYAYKGVPDQEVKKIIGQAMQKNGLCIIPTKVVPKTQIDRWDEQGKTKQSVFTEVEAEYLLLHSSGESVTLSGYGHGVDTQDKGAGKATTYALKYALLYTFLVPTGKIDDTDTEHSEEKGVPEKKSLPPQLQALPEKAFNEAVARIEKGEVVLYDKLKAGFTLTPAQIKVIEGHIKNISTNQAIAEATQK